MRKLAINVAYDGTDFSGWQIQKTGRTVQGVLENALSEICKQEVKIMGSGRTDTGVHALNQIAHFEFPHTMETSRVKIALHTKLPYDIRINKVHDVPDNFHARYDAFERSYRYILTTERTPFNRYYKTFLPRKKLDINLIKAAIPYFIGEHDFLAFSKPNPDIPNTICNLKRLVVFQQDNDYVWELSANRFLHNLVRRIVGTLINISHNKLDPDIINYLFEKGKMNQKYVFTAPPQGLYLTEVKYKKELLLNPDKTIIVHS